MPTARIITSTTNQALPLAERLRSHGFTVETIAPGEITKGPVDLEVTLTTGRKSEVLKQIADGTVSGAPEIYIAAGTLHSASSPARVVGSRAPTVADTMNGVAAGLQNKRDLLARALREHRTVLRQARIAERQRAKAAKAAPPSENFEVPQRTAAPVEEPVVVLPESSGDTAMESPQQHEHSGVSNLPAAEAPNQSDWNSPAPVQPEPNVAEPTPVAEQIIPVFEQPVPAEQLTPVAEQIIPVFEQPVPAEQPTPVAQQPAPVEALTGSAAPPNVVESAAGKSEALHVATRQPRRRAVRLIIPRGKRASRRVREWRAAVLISSLFASLLMLGWTAVTRSPVSPLPRSLSTQTGIEESVPFGAVTLKPSAIPSPPPSYTHPAPRPAPAAKTRLALQKRSRVAVSSKEKASEKPSRKQRSARRSSEDDIAEDRVIIHRSPPLVQPTESQKASLKRFSD